MYFLLSGEGPTDLRIGRTRSAICEGDDCDLGPMVVISSPNSLKDELRSILQRDTTREALCEKARTSFNIEKIKMPSFMAFRERLEEVIA